MDKITLILKRPDSLYVAGEYIRMSMPADSTLSEFLDFYKRFLIAAGFSLSALDELVVEQNNDSVIGSKDE